MDKFNMETKDLAQENIEKIGQLFPNVITEMKDENGNLKKGINFELLKQELSKDIVENDEHFEFTWVGKMASMVEANTPIRKTLRPAIEESKNWETTENIYIEGDNLDVLKLLQESYLGKIKMIYIDPPYNTGNDSFVYPDKYEMDKEEYEEQIQLRDDEENINFRQNSDSNPRFHSDWRSMIYPRLKLAHSLLSENGVVFISIDDNEVHNLRKICDELFGSDNLVETFYLQVRYADKSLNEKDSFQKLIEQVLIYAKNKNEFSPKKPFEEYSLSTFQWQIELISKGQEMTLGGKKVWLFKSGEYIIKQIPNSIKALKATWASGSVLKGNTSGKFFDKQLSNRTLEDGYGCLYKVEGIGEDGLGYRFFTGPKKPGATKGQFYSGVPLMRIIELENGCSRKYKPIINFYDYAGDFGNISHEGGIAFRSGKKPTKMLMDFMRIADLKEKDIVLDFFSGSASTAHSLMLKNLDDNDNCTFILIQLPEETPEQSDYRSAGFSNICEIGKERIRRAGEKIKKDIEEENQKNKLIGEQKKVPDIGFRVFKVDSTNMKDVFYSANEYTQEKLIGLESNIKEDRSDLDLLYGVLLEWGLPLSLPHQMEKIEDVTIHLVDQIALIACFDDHISEKVFRDIAKRQPLRVVFRDSSFSSSPEKINVEEIFKLLSPNTSVKVL